MWQRGRGGLVVGESCCSRLEGFPGGFLLPAVFLASSEHVPFPSPVPGGIASESLTFTPLEDMIFLKWEEPVEPNGLITQYEVGPGRLWHPQGTHGDTGGSRLGRGGAAGGIWGNCCFRSWGLRVAAALLLPPSPSFGAQIQPAFILLLAGSVPAGQSCFWGHWYYSATAFPINLCF